MTSSASLLVIGRVLTAALVISCSQSENKTPGAEANVAPTVSQTAPPAASPTPRPSVSGAAAPPISQIKSLPPEGGDIPTEAEFNGYAYSYKKDSKKTVATFAGNLPPDRDVVVGAIRDVIARSYGDKIDSALRLAGSGAEQSMRIASKKHQYVVVPVREATGEIHSLIITQLSD